MSPDRRGVRGLTVLTLCIAGAVAISPIAALEPPAQRTVIQTDYGDKLQVDPSPALALGSELTVEMWVRLYEPGVPGASVLLAKTQDGLPSSFNLFLEDEGLAPVLLILGADGKITRLKGGSLAVGEWQHVAATLAGGVARLVIDGEEAGVDVNAPSAPTANVDHSLAIGSQIRGALRQVRVWSRVLSPAEIAGVAATEVTGGEPGLVAAWPLDDGTGRNARNLVPSGGPLRLLPSFQNGEAVWVRAETVSHPYFAAAISPAAHEHHMGGVLDLDLDGDLDLLAWRVDYATYAPQPLLAYRNSGAAAFADATSSLIAPPAAVFQAFARPLTIVDLTGDGLDDVLAPDYGPDAFPITGGRASVLVRQPDGSLRDETDGRVPPVMVNSHGWSVGDVDGDGDRDVFLLAFGDNSAPPLVSRLLLNDGAGHFVEKADWLSAEWAGIYLASELVDADGDGDLDLALGSAGQSAFPVTRERDRLLLNDGNGSFSAAEVALPRRYRGVGWATYDIRSADLDGDGDSDLALTLAENDQAVGAVGERLQILLGDGEGSFRDASLGVPQGASTPVNGTLWALDVNGDGHVDLVKSAATTFRQELYLNLGNARFVDAGEVFPLGHARLFPGDLDGDNDIDFAGFPLWRPEIVALEAVRPLDLATWNDYSLCVYPGHIDVPVGKSATMQVAVNRAGFAAPVELSARSATPGLAFAFSAATNAGDEVVSLTVSAAATVPPGKYPATVMARSGEAAHSQEIVVIVSRAPVPLRRGTRGGG